MMISICMFCGAIKSGTDGELSHGLCYPCALFFYGYYVPALMKPKADRYIDCPRCYYKDVDSDGVPDGCNRLIGEPCIAPGKRSPWL